MQEDQSAPETQPTPPESPVVTSQPPAPAAVQPPKRRKWLAQLPLAIALLIIVAMLAMWKPWDPAPKAGDRTITVTGTAELTAEPDEYTFTPQYEFKNADRAAALSQSTAKLNQIVAKLKELGVPDNKIKTDTSGYNYYSSSQNTYYSSLEVIVDDKDRAQKVQDYLLTTTPSGSVTPYAEFSKTKRKTLTDKGRDEATKDARAKAEQSAKNLGFKLGKVKNVKDDPSSGIPYFYDSITQGATSASAEDKSSPIHVGENDLSYEVSVTYYLR